MSHPMNTEAQQAEKPVKLWRFAHRNGSATTVSGRTKTEAKRAIGGGYVEVREVGYEDAHGQWHFLEENKP